MLCKEICGYLIVINVLTIKVSRMFDKDIYIYGVIFLNVYYI